LRLSVLSPKKPLAHVRGPCAFENVLVVVVRRVVVCIRLGGEFLLRVFFCLLYVSCLLECNIMVSLIAAVVVGMMSGSVPHYALL